MIESISGVLFWAFFGILIVLIQYGITLYLKKKGRNTIGLQIGGFLFNFLFVFTLMWAYSSYVETEYQAIAMGFVFFGGLSLIPAVITWRLANMKKGAISELIKGKTKKTAEKEVTE
jgi:ABC-type transport system involved in multi-copper enzyme maturation permease subunit